MPQTTYWPTINRRIVDAQRECNNRGATMILRTGETGTQFQTDFNALVTALNTFVQTYGVYKEQP